MTRSELIQRMVEKYAHLPASDVVASVNALFDAMSESLASGHRLELRGFGVFSLRLRKANIGRNPVNGDKVNVPAKYVCHFKTGTYLHKRLNPS